MSTDDSDVVEELRDVFDSLDVDPDAEADRVDTAFQDALNGTAADSLPAELVKASLPAVLLALLETRDHEHHGKALRDDLTRTLGHRFSPGTIYPVLNDLDETGVLSVQDRASNEKHYAFADREAAYARIEETAEQHAALARFLHQALEP